MKHYLMFLVLIMTGSLFGQVTVGPLLNDYREDVYKTSGGSYGGSGLVGSNSLLYVGRTSGTRYRCFYQWVLPDNVLPDGANISQAKLEFDISRISGPQTATFVFASIQGDLTTASQQSLFDETESASTVGDATTTNHFERTFIRGESFITWILNQLSNNKFTLGIWLPTDYGYDYLHYISSGTVKLTFWIDPVGVTADQVFEDGNTRIPNSSVGHYEGGTFAPYGVPHQFTFDVNTTQTFDADINLVLNQQTGLQEKYRTWNGLANVVNHKDFLIKPDLPNVISQFKTSNNASLQGLLIDGGNPGGAMDFADPWLRDSSDSKGPLNRGMGAVLRSVNPGINNIGLASSYKGVFWNESGPPSWNPPYYSINAPYQNTINGYTAFFQNWDDSNPSQVSYQNASTQQTGVVFKQSGATATAKYKAQLASSMANATGSNSQRLIASSGNNVFWVTYPSAGELWWNTSGDGGANWWDDIKFTTSSNTASAPSLAVWKDATLLDAPGQPSNMEPYVVYRTQSGSNYNIKYCILNTGTPYPIPTSTQLNAVAIPTSIDTRPVIARLNDYGSDELWAFWQSATSLNYNYAYKSGSTWNWVGEQGYFSGLQNPSLSAPDLTVSTSNWYLTYDNANDVYIISYPDNTLDGVAVPASIGPTSFASQVSADSRTGEQVHVVWEAFGETEIPPGTDRGTTWLGDTPPVQRHRVMYQKWDGAQWGAAYEFRSNTLNYYRPTVSNLSNGHVAWAWDDGSSTYKALYNGSSWSVTETYANTTRPNLGTNGSNGMITSTRFVSTSTTGAPYRLNVGAAVSRPQNDLQTSIVPEQYTRKVIVARNPSRKAGSLPHRAAKDGPNEADTSSYLSVELAPIMLKLHDGSIVTVDFPSPGDSIMDERSVWGSLASTPVMLTSGIDSVFINGSADAYAPMRLVGREIGLSFDVVDAERGTVLRRIGAERVFNTDSAAGFSFRGHLAGLIGRRVFLRPNMRGFEKGGRSLVSTLVHVYTLLDDAVSKPEASLAKTSDSQVSLPTTFALHQNYPNPFNPTTEIRFDLPDAGNVSLVVFDVLGREVVDLATGYHEAGYHTATWNAAGQASGVYFARFNVTSPEGKGVYSKISKLVLMK